MQATTKKNVIISACYAGTVILGMLIGPKFFKENANSRNGTFLPFAAGGRADKVERVLNLIEDNYVDPVRTDSLKDLAITQILKKLDPHSSYLPPAEARSFSDNLEGNYFGIGVEYQILNDTVLVTAVHHNGPAELAGMRTGDQVIKVNGKSIAGNKINTSRMVGLIKGPRGTEVKLQVKRSDGIKNISVVRDKITISSLDAAFMMDDRTGYIKISRFGAATDDDFVKRGNELKKAGMRNLILDLRGNGGGYLNAATAIADEFLEDKKLIVFTKGEHEPRTDYFATAKGIFEKGKLVVLIDENSASASEILAGAIQDLDRGTVIGRRSFGKGLVQEQFNFGDGSALNLTVARYFTPSGRSIQKPYKAGADKYYEEIAERLKNGELAGKHADSVGNRLKVYKTQGGRAIYGGGGIAPDIFVPIDTLSLNDTYFALSAKGVFSDFAYKNYGQESKPASLDVFIKNFKLDDEAFLKLQRLAQQRKIELDASGFARARQAIAVQIKALVARYYFGDEGYYKVKNLTDRTVLKALEVLSK